MLANYEAWVYFQCPLEGGIQEKKCHFSTMTRNYAFIKNGC